MYKRQAEQDPNIANTALTYVNEHQRGDAQPVDGNGKHYVPQVKMEGVDGLAEQVRFSAVKRGEEVVKPKIVRLD